MLLLRGRRQIGWPNASSGRCRIACLFILRGEEFEIVAAGEGRRTKVSVLTPWRTLRVQSMSLSRSLVQSRPWESSRRLRVYAAENARQNVDACTRAANSANPRDPCTMMLTVHAVTFGRTSVMNLPKLGSSKPHVQLQARVPASSRFDDLDSRDWLALQGRSCHVWGAQ